MWTLLREKNFRLLWAGQLSSQFGDRLTQLLLVALVAQRAAGSSFTLAKVMAATSLPALLVNPFAGAFVDRWDRKRTMIVCDLIRAGAILLLPAAAAARTQIPLYLDVFLLFAVAAFFIPARLAMIPDLVPPGKLAQANALFSSSGMIGSTFILLIGALLVEWIGVGRSALVNAAAYVTSACFILPIIRKGRHPAPPPPSKPAKGEESPRRILVEIFEGVRELWAHRSTRRIIWILGGLMAGAGGTMVAATVLVQRWLGTVTKDIGFLSLWLGVGMLAGTLAHGRWGASRSKRVVLGLCFLGCGLSVWGFLAGVAMLHSGVAASVAAGVMGLFIAPVGIVTNTMVHEAHPERLHGRIFSSLGVAVNVALISSMLLAGWAGERWGEGRFLSSVGAAFALAGIALLYYGKRRSSR